MEIRDNLPAHSNGSGPGAGARVRGEARAAGFDGLLRTHRVNRSYEQGLWWNGIAVVIAGAACIGCSVFLELPWLAAQIAVVVLIDGVMGLPILAIGGRMLREAYRQRRAGPALVHLFEGGLIVERTRGGLVVLPRASQQVRHVTWSIDNQDFEQIWIGLPNESDTGLGAGNAAEQAALADIATHIGLSGTPVDQPGSEAPDHW